MRHALKDTHCWPSKTCSRDKLACKLIWREHASGWEHRSRKVNRVNMASRLIGSHLKEPPRRWSIEIWCWMSLRFHPAFELAYSLDSYNADHNDHPLALRSPRVRSPRVRSPPSEAVLLACASSGEAGSAALDAFVAGAVG